MHLTPANYEIECHTKGIPTQQTLWFKWAHDTCCRPTRTDSPGSRPSSRLPPGPADVHGSMCHQCRDVCNCNYSTSVTLVVSRTYSEKVCPMRVTVLFETATPLPHASGQSPRGGDRHGPNHISSDAFCVKLSELTSSILAGVTGRAAAIARPRPADCLSTLFSSGIGRNSSLYCCAEAISGTALAKAALRPCLLSASLRSPLTRSLSLPPCLPRSLPPSVAPNSTSTSEYSVDYFVIVVRTSATMHVKKLRRRPLLVLCHQWEWQSR